MFQNPFGSLNPKMSVGENLEAPLRFFTVGRSLTIDPDLLICDEITSALDVSVQALLVEQLRQLQHERHLSLIFVTHNLAVVRSIAQRVVVLAHGRVVEQGLVENVLVRPQHPYTQQLLLNAPDIDAPA